MSLGAVVAGTLAQPAKSAVKIRTTGVDFIKFALHIGIRLLLFGRGVFLAVLATLEIPAEECGKDGRDDGQNCGDHVDHPNRLASRHQAHQTPAAAPDMAT